MKSSSLKLLAGTLLGSLLLASVTPSFARSVACPKPLTQANKTCYTPTITIDKNTKPLWAYVTPYTNIQIKKSSTSVISFHSGWQGAAGYIPKAGYGTFRGYASTTGQPKLSPDKVRNILLRNDR